MPNIHLLGIRHHGPGCTRNLEKALAKIQPDMVLLEMPADVPQEILKAVQNKDLQPPVALLMYNPDNLKQAAFYPFAEYSPEWKTLQYCFDNQIHIRPFDLPKSIDFGWAIAKAQAEAENPPLQNAQFSQDAETEETQDAATIHRDPIAYIANLAGYTDSERWWDAVIESSGEDVEIFQSIVEMMTALRENLGIVESAETLMREAYMRETLRDVIKIGYKNIAIVCGAWHTPALLDANFQKKEDSKMFKGIKKQKVAHSWIPWTYQRLSFASGYGAGVISPAWYEILYHEKKENVVTYWMSRAAQLLRKQDLDASSAHIIEAVRLSETLATLRDLVIPGLDEMLEATTAIFGEGYPDKLKVIEKELVIGTKMGEVPDDLQNVPFQKDMEAQRKTLRLKDNTIKELKIDLREPAGLTKSQFLHRLKLLEIPWGKVVSTSQDSNKSKIMTREEWELVWKPEFMLNVIEASMWGNTVFDAAQNYAISKAGEGDTLELLGTLLENCEKAGLGNAIGGIIVKLQDLATVSTDVLALISLLPKLINTERYANTTLNKTSADFVAQMIREIVPRVCISIVPATTALSEEAADGMWKSIAEMTKTLTILSDSALFELWIKALQQIVIKDNIDGVISGGILRTLYDKGYYTQEQAQNAMSQALSKGVTPLFSTRWIGGYLSGGVTILVHKPEFLKLIHTWLTSLNDDNFQEVLVLLRRIFKDYALTERQKIFEMAISGWQPPKLTQEINLHEGRKGMIQEKWKEWTGTLYGA
ncbi:MAG: DUF5682 family protein [Bacteroidia bacterium]